MSSLCGLRGLCVTHLPATATQDKPKNPLALTDGFTAPTPFPTNEINASNGLTALDPRAPRPWA